MFFDTKKKLKAKKAIWALKQIKLKATYTYKFNIHSHQTKLETPTLISKKNQTLKKSIWHSLLIDQAEFTNLSALANFVICLNNTIKSTDATPTMYTPVSNTNAMDIPPEQ